MASAADDIIELYRRFGSKWVAARGAALHERAWIERFAGLLHPNATVLDIGCGSGVPIARHVAGLGHAVTGVDASTEMIAMFRANLPDQKAEVADMRALNLGRKFGGVIAWDSFFHLKPDDQRAMFPIFRAHAEEGAPLLFTSGPKSGEAIGTLEGAPLYHASLDPDEYRARLADNDFDVIAHIAEDPTCGGHTIWLARRS